MALSRSALSILAEGMILVGIIKYAERTLCMCLASRSRFKDSMRMLPDLGPIYHRKTEQYILRNEEGYRVETDEVSEVWAPGDLSVKGGRSYEGEASALVKACKLFSIFRLLFVDLMLKSGDLKASERIFTEPDMDSVEAFTIVEMELGFLYDLLYTKAKLLSRAWGIIRWVINLSVQCAVLVLFSLQDKKGYPKVDIWITFLLVSVTILLEVYSLHDAISSDRVDYYLLQRPRWSLISSAIRSVRFLPKRRWGNSVAHLSLLRFSIEKRHWIFHKYPTLAVLREKVYKNYYVHYKKFESSFKVWIFKEMKETALHIRSLSFKEEAREVLKKKNLDELGWSMEGLFDQRILIWHIATKLCYYKDRDDMQEQKGSDDFLAFKMSKLVSRYMLYLLVFHPSMLPIVIGEVRHEDTWVEAQYFFQDKKEELAGSGDCVCRKKHKSRESNDLCKAYRLLLKVRTNLPARKLRGDKSTSVLFDGCHLAFQLGRQHDSKWDAISKVWAKMLLHSAHQSKGYEHCESLSRGGELLRHIWLLMAHLGIVQTTESSGGDRRITRLITT